MLGALPSILTENSWTKMQSGSLSNFIILSLPNGHIILVFILVFPCFPPSTYGAVFLSLFPAAFYLMHYDRTGPTCVHFFFSSRRHFRHSFLFHVDTKRDRHSLLTRKNRTNVKRVVRSSFSFCSEQVYCHLLMAFFFLLRFAIFFGFRFVFWSVSFRFFIYQSQLILFYTFGKNNCKYAFKLICCGQSVFEFSFWQLFQSNLIISWSQKLIFWQSSRLTIRLKLRLID